MRKYNTILFDLDGTILDSAQGIFNCLDFSLQHFGIKQPRETFYKCLGPALRTSFSEFLPQENVEEAVKIYRSRYAEKGLYECNIYEGAVEMLRELKEKGYCIAIATSKPEIYAKRILEHFNINGLFDFIGGAAMDNTRDTKTDVIKYVMHSLNLKKEDCVMVGDRMHDMHGAAECGIDAVGVLYGYGSSEELCDGFSPVFLASTAKELCEWILYNERCT